MNCSQARKTACLIIPALALALLFSFKPTANAGDMTGYALVFNGVTSAEEAPEAAAAVAIKAGLAVRYISDLEELPQMLKQAAVFIIGGTEDDLSPLVRAFTPRITSSLKDYLKNGGRYLGICGGGFMASTGWDETPVRRQKGLGLVSAGTNTYREEYKPQIYPIRWKGVTRPMYFKGGPFFTLNKGAKDIEIIGTYEDGSIAALTSSYGGGNIAVVGPHPEAPDSWFAEAAGNRPWSSSIDLAVGLLKDLLSDRAAGQ